MESILSVEWLLKFSIILSLIVVINTCYLVISNHFKTSYWNRFIIFCSFIAQLNYLIWNGINEHSCPITNLSEIFIFISCIMTILFFLLSIYFSSIDLFIFPLLLILQVIGLLYSSSLPHALLHNTILSLHATFGLCALSLIGISSIASMMFLVQEKELRSGHPHPIFLYLPSIHSLNHIMNRFFISSFVFFSFCLILGYIFPFQIHWIKLYLSIAIWLIYSVILYGIYQKYFWGKLLAYVIIFIFLIFLLILPLLR